MKRTSDHQLTKDNADDADTAADEPQQGFERASPEVLARRRILRVKRTPNLPPPATAPGPNPFAALARSPATVAPKPAETPLENSAENSIENSIEKPAGAPLDKLVDKPEVPSVEKSTEIFSEKLSEAPAEKPTEAQPEKAAEPTVETKAANLSEKYQEKPMEIPGVKPTKPPAKRSSLPSDNTNGAGLTKLDTARAPESATAKPSSETLPTHVNDPSDQSKPAPFLSAPQATPVPLKPTAIPANSTPKSTITFGSTTKPITFATAAQSDGFKFKSTGAPPKVEEKKIEFKEATVLTGEEKDKELLRTRAKLYTLETKEDGSRWKERSVGVLKLNKNTETGKARLLMRTEATLRVVLNTPIFKGFQMDRATDRSIRFQGFDVDDQKRTSSFLARFATKDVTSNMIEAIEKFCKEFCTGRVP